MNELLKGVRGLLRNPSYTVPAVFVLSLGMFASIVIFGLFDAVVLKAVPYPDAGRLVAVFGRSRQAGDNKLDLLRSEAEQIRKLMSGFEDLGYYSYGQGVNLDSGTKSRLIPDAKVSVDFFRTLGTYPIWGRLFTSEDFSPGSERVVIIGYSLWRQWFGGTTEMTGRKLRLGTDWYSVVGVMPERMPFPNSDIQIWFPDVQSKPSTQDKDSRDRGIVARLKHGVSIVQARAELALVSRIVMGNKVDPTFPDLTFDLERLEDQIIGSSGKIMSLMLGAVLLTLLIACANVANLTLARNTARQKEVAIRLALGGKGLRIIRQLLMESIALALVGGGLGLVAAVEGLRITRSIASPSLVDGSLVRIDPAVVLFAVGISLISGILFGLVPAIHVIKTDVYGHLQEASAGSRTGFNVVRGRRLQSIFAMSQIAITLVLAIGFGLLLKSLTHFLSVDLGFQPRNLLAIQLGPSPSQSVANMQSALQHIPGVKAVGIGTLRPLLGVTFGTFFSAQESGGNWIMSPGVESQSVNGTYFGAMGIPLLEGRSFTEADTRASPCVVVVSEELRQLLWPDGKAVGRRIDLNRAFGLKPYPCEVVGVVGDVRDEHIEKEAAPEIYFSYLQHPDGNRCLLVRAFPRRVLDRSTIVGIVNNIDPSIQLQSVDTVADLVDKSIYLPRLRTLILGLFAILACVIAAIGLYGSMSYAVNLRKREIGIRKALGAHTIDILRLTMRDSALAIGCGLVVGLLVAFPLTRLAGSILYDVKPFDIDTYFGVTVVISIVAAFGSFIPAYRAATREDFSVLLREE